MNESLCDRCFACAQQVLETYDNKEKFKTNKDIKDYIKYILKILDETNNDNYPSRKVDSLAWYEYQFLNEKCSDCSINNNDLSKKNISLYIKIELVNKIFETILNNRELSYEILNNYKFKNILKIKLLQIQFNKRNNVNYNFELFLKSRFTEKDIGPIGINFKELSKINEYYKSLFGIPIYLGNFDVELYQERAKLKLDELIPKHPLVLNKEKEGCLMPYLQYYQLKYFN